MAISRIISIDYLIQLDSDALDISRTLSEDRATLGSDPSAEGVTEV
jgi:hypothetical protein